MKKSLFGRTKGNQEVYLYTLETEAICLTVSDIGATITNLRIKDKNNQWTDVVLGYDTCEAYLKNTRTYFGSTIGRNANRIENAEISLEGKRYQLTKNDGENNLHSGIDGFQTRVWSVTKFDATSPSITFSLFSPDGDQGFPGNLTMSVCYTLEHNNLKITFNGKTDQTTVFNPTNHTYFNLNGHHSGDILTHRLQLNATEFTPLKDSQAIPSGEIISVKQTPFDFSTPKLIGQDIDKNHEQIVFAGGYDHNYMINKEKETLEFFAKVIALESGIEMSVATDLPGVQFYTANFLENELGKEKMVYRQRAGFCLETQYFPNAVNTVNFATPLLNKDESKTYTTIYHFETKDH